MLKAYFSDLRKEFKGYSFQYFMKDVLAGITVAAVALPLALAFGVSSGADAASGLITAIIAGFLIGGLSGASYQISGPTGAMTAILLTLSLKYGLEGVFCAGMLSGILLLVAGIFHVGKLVSYIPSAVITGFTSGIAVIIAGGQLDNFFGVTSTGENMIQKILSYGELGFSPNLQAVFFAVLVMVIMIVWPKKWNAKIPSSLAGIIIALVVQLMLKLDVATVGAIPQTLLPENRLMLSNIPWSDLQNLIMPAFSIAALGMIESLLCGASASKMTKEKLRADQELIAQGIGNIVIPFFGGVPATAAIARTSVAIKSGGKTRMVSIIHALGLVASMFLLGPFMAKIPLAALAGVLVMTAWRMNEWEAIKSIFVNKRKTSILQFLITMFATIVFDLTIAIMIGVLFSMLVFVVKSCQLKIDVSDIDLDRLKDQNLKQDHKHTKLLYLSGPLFFGTQDILRQKIEEIDYVENIILSMRGVPQIDDSALLELHEIIDECNEKGICVLFCGLQYKVKQAFDNYGLTAEIGEERFSWDAIQAIKSIDF